MYTLKALSYNDSNTEKHWSFGSPDLLQYAALISALVENVKEYKSWEVLPET